MSYNPSEIEAKWQKQWDDEQAFEPSDSLDTEEKIYFKYVPFPKWKTAYGTCKKLRDR